MKQSARRSECSPLLASLIAGGLALGFCGCTWLQPKPLLDTRQGIVPPPYQAPSEPTVIAATAVSPEPAFPAPTMPEPTSIDLVPEPDNTTVEAIPETVDKKEDDSKKEAAPTEIVLPPVPEVKPITYTVRKNDSLWVIARRHGITYQELAAANKLDPNAVLPEGKILLIPPGGRPGAASEGRSATVRTPAPVKAVVTGPTGIYTVQRGDCLSKIAARHKMKTAELRSINGLTDDKIYIGQKLKIRGKPVAATSKPPIKESTDGGTGVGNGSAKPDNTTVTKPDEPTRPDTGAATKPDEPTKPGTGGITIAPIDPGKTGTKPAPDEPPKGSIVVKPLPPATGGASLRKLPHDICKDDTLENIAEIYGTTVTAILQANPTIKSNADLKEGKTIMVPYK